jgi:hypothetical protein
MKEWITSCLLANLEGIIVNDSPFGPTSRRRFLAVAGVACASGIVAQTATAADEADAPRRVFSTDREDGRFTSSPAFIHAYLKHLKPKLAFDPEMDPQDFPAWRDAVRTKLLELMGFPEFDQPQPPPKRLWQAARRLPTTEMGSLSRAVQRGALSGSDSRRRQRPVARTGCDVLSRLIL